MTGRDTHDLRLSKWPRLSTLPTTNAMLTVVMVLWLATGCTVLLGATVPDRWFGALEVFTGIVVVQFIGKRGTDSTLWRKSATGDSTTTSTSTVTTKTGPVAASLPGGPGT